jgi:hypothetical protein
LTTLMPNDLNLSIMLKTPTILSASFTPHHVLFV